MHPEDKKYIIKDIQTNPEKFIKMLEDITAYHEWQEEKEALYNPELIEHLKQFATVYSEKAGKIDAEAELKLVYNQLLSWPIDKCPGPLANWFYARSSMAECRYCKTNIMLKLHLACDNPECVIRWSLYKEATDSLVEFGKKIIDIEPVAW